MAKKQVNANIILSLVLAGLLIFIFGKPTVSKAPHSSPAPFREELAEVDEPELQTLWFHSLAEPLPLVMSTSFEEANIQSLLKEGAVILPVGNGFNQAGNMVIVAHSSGLPWFGPYRFAFSELSDLGVGDEFRITIGDSQYTYRVFEREIVHPEAIYELPQDTRSTVTLVTCWPVWTDFKRLLIHGELSSGA
ncbi:MAG: sortase [Candidatus Andersenbacteria bacterium]